MSERDWKVDAVRIVEELFPATPSSVWDELLDLRRLILSGGDWPAAIGVFLACRQKLEQDHYLPFYRLRRLLAVSLELEGIDLPSLKLERLLRCRSYGHLTREIQREIFEHLPASEADLRVRLVEA